MGTNRRYEKYYDRKMDTTLARADVERLASSFPLQSLTPEELALAEEPMTRDPRPHRRVRAWVRFGPHPAQVDAVVHCWTERAVGIAFTVADRELKAWVWASAVHTPG